MLNEWYLGVFCATVSHDVCVSCLVSYSKKGHGRKDNRNTKFGRGGPPPAREGKRQYDRKSGTGRGKEIKKGGGGAHNWGSDSNEAKALEGAVVEGQEDAPIAEGAVETPEEEKEPEPEPEPEDNTLSYEEYMAQKAEQQSDNLKPIEVREVENEFGTVKAKEAVEEDFLVMGGGKAKKTKKQKEKEAVSIDVGFRAAGEGGSNFREGGGRGRGRGRGRDSEGGRGRGRYVASLSLHISARLLAFFWFSNFVFFLYFSGGRGRGEGRGRGRGEGRGRGGRGGR